ncbi:MAG: hypothetical protein R3E39_17660 [Anaerolineae bacterium]
MLSTITPLQLRPISFARKASPLPLHDTQHALLVGWRGEVLRRFGAVIPTEQMPRAVTQARSRLGGALVKLLGMAYASISSHSISSAEM